MTDCYGVISTAERVTTLLSTKQMAELLLPGAPLGVLWTSVYSVVGIEPKNAPKCSKPVPG